MRALCAQGKADAELVGALGDGVGDNAVETDGGENKGENGESGVYFL